MLYRAMFRATSPIGVLDRYPVSCIAVSDKYPLHRTGAEHPVLGALYASDQEAARKRSLTDRYFHLMGLQGSNYLPGASMRPTASCITGTCSSARTTSWRRSSR